MARSMRTDPIRLWFSASLWRATALALSSAVLAVVWASLLASLIGLGLVLTVTLIGLPLLAGTMVIWTYAARSERWRLKVLSGASVSNPYRILPTGSAWRRVLAFAADPAVWRDLAYLLLALPVLGALELVVLVGAVAVPLGLLAMPAYYRLTAPELWTGFRVDTLPRALVAAGVGLALVLPAPYLVIAFARLPVAVA